MQWLLNLPTVLWRRLLLILQGLGALLALIATGLGALFGKGGTVGSRLGDALGAPASQRRVFAVLRLFQPNLVLKRQIITSYANNGITALATRSVDVTDILSRDADFGVVYGPRMEMITGGENFFLGMQDTPRYTRDVSNMRLAVRRDDVAVDRHALRRRERRRDRGDGARRDRRAPGAHPAGRGAAARPLFRHAGPVAGVDRRMDHAAVLVPVHRPQGRSRSRRARHRGGGRVPQPGWTAISPRAGPRAAARTTCSAAASRWATRACRG